MADRRFGLAHTLAAEGDNLASADLLEQTLELVPAWAPAWLALGLARERIGQMPEARAAFRRACALDVDGRLGASVYLARAEGADGTAMPAAFVRALFDQYADRFDAHLTGELNYTGPALVAEALQRHGVVNVGPVLDLGCGTGLMARAMSGRAAAIDGVDLAPQMIRHAEATGLYRRLTSGEIVAFLRSQPDASYEAVLAADVLVYFGDLAPVAEQVLRALSRGGAFAFTVQRGADRDYLVGADMRFHHSQRYVVGTLATAGFASIAVEDASTRSDRGQPVPGLVVVARRP